MKFSEKWLREWVDPALSTQQLADQLTMAGLEVDAITPAGARVSGVVVGEVLEVARHPDAERLSVCRVSDGRGEYQVVPYMQPTTVFASEEKAQALRGKLSV